MTSALKITIMFVLLIGFSACSGGNSGGTETGSVVGDLTSAIRAAVKAPENTGSAAAQPGRFDIATAFTSEQVDALTTPTIVAVVETRQAWTMLTEVMANNGFQTFWTEDQIAITLRGGVIVSTRGITGDLFASTPGPVLGALAAGQGRYDKSFRYLNSVSQLETLRLTCQLRPAGTERFTIAERAISVVRFDETCIGNGQERLNSYWRLPGQNRPIRSRQWISDRVGYVDIFHIKS